MIVNWISIGIATPKEDQKIWFYHPRFNIVECGIFKREKVVGAFVMENVVEGIDNTIYPHFSHWTMITLNKPEPPTL
jgi:hypothetical protein